MHVKCWKRRGRSFVMRQKSPDEVFTMVPPDPLVPDIESMMKMLRSAKKGSAGGPSGMTGTLEASLKKVGLQRCWRKIPPSSQGVKFQKKFCLQ